MHYLSLFINIRVYISSTMYCNVDKQQQKFAKYNQASNFNEWYSYTYVPYSRESVPLFKRKERQIMVTIGIQADNLCLM